MASSRRVLVYLLSSEYVMFSVDCCAQICEAMLSRDGFNRGYIVAIVSLKLTNSIELI